MNTKKEDSKILFEVDGFKVYSDSFYVIEGKPDSSAPTGFQERGLTKSPDAGVSADFQCPFVPEAPGSEKGVWDTGFYTSSPCYAQLDQETVKAYSAQRKKNVLDPYLKAVGKSDDKTAYDQNDHERWMDLNFSVYLNKVFSTTNAKNVMELYMALLSRKACPKEKVRDLGYSGASYTVVDKKSATEYRKDLVSSKYKAITSMMTLLNTDPDRLHVILKYVDVRVAKTTTETNLVATMDDRFTNVKGAIDEFQKAVKSSETEDGLALMIIYSKLTDVKYKGKVTKGLGGMIYYNGVEIGPDLKAGSSRINKNPELKEIKSELLLS
jgi:hypothetical protein